MIRFVFELFVLNLFLNPMTITFYAFAVVVSPCNSDL